MAAFPEPRRWRRRWTLGFGLLAVALAFAAGIALWQVVALSSVSAVESELDRLRPLLTAARWAAIGFVALLWPLVIGRLHRGGRLNEHQHAMLLGLRWRVVAWLAVIELVLGQNLIGRFAGTLTA